MFDDIFRVNIDQIRGRIGMDELFLKTGESSLVFVLSEMLTYLAHAHKQNKQHLVCNDVITDKLAKV